MSAPSGKMVRWITTGIVAAVVLIVGVIWISKVTSIPSTGNDKEAALNAQYSHGASTLSTCLTKTHQAANVASANAEAFDKVIKDAIAGQGQSANVNFKQPGAGNSLLPILVQAYPDLKGQTDLFNQVVIIIAGCQDDFRNTQAVVLDKVRDLDSWRLNWWNSFFGSDEFPNENLIVAVPGTPKLRGADALDKMREPIISNEAAGAYQNGTYTPTDPFPASPAPSR